MELDRRHFLESCAAVGLGGTLLPAALYAQARQDEELTTRTIAQAEKLAGLSFSEEQRALMLEDLRQKLRGYRRLWEVDIPNSVFPALWFDPRIGTIPDAPPAAHVPPDSDDRADASGDADGGWAGSSGARPRAAAAWEPEPFQRPAGDEDLAYLPISRLSSLLRSRQVSSMELTELYLARLKKYDSVLHAVITLTEERAREEAARADRELDAGRWRGPLHGIPWGAKDLLAARGYPTTWGAAPYRDQVIDEDSAVVQRLDEAGAVLVAKLTLGALAWGDVWFGGQTKSPWNIEQGSSGSSAGPAASVAAGLVGFAVGSETLGSIVSPSTRNGVTGLRPTFGRVSRHGAMALSWSMDKLGPLCRSAEDCALVFSALHGRDPRDPSTVDAPFEWPGVDVGELRVGYPEQAFEGEYEGRKADQRSLEVLRGLGIDLRPFSLPDMPVQPLLVTLEAEAASAFDELTRSGGVDRMVRQIRRAWPNVFRQAHLIPAVEYIQANRARTLLMRAMAEAMRELDVFVSPSFRGGTLSITNLTGHPSVTVPNDFRRLNGAPLSSPRRQPGSITFVGGLYREEAALALAQAYQRTTDFHRRRPPIA